MSLIPLGPWEPDSAGVSGQALTIAENVYPVKSGYGPLPSLVDVSVATLPGRCIGLYVARTTSGGWIIFAGTRTGLYRYVSSTWVDYTRTSGGAYNVPDSDYWSFAQFGSLVIACNINDDVQGINVDSGATVFSALGGSPPKARYVSVVGDFVLLACLQTNNRMVQNSGINDATSWTAGVSLSDIQEFPDGGRVTGVAGGEFGWIVQERAVRRMIFQPGSDQAFRFERLEKERGSVAGYSVVSVQNTVFFMSSDGFYAFDQNGLRPIGAQRINDWFRDNSDTARSFSVLAFSDPYHPRIAWAFYNNSGSTYFDRLLIYDWQIDRWTYANVTAQMWASLATPGLVLEDLDIYGSLEAVPYSLDSRVWEGGAPVIGSITTVGRLAYLEGTIPMTATLTTAPLQLGAPGRANVGGTQPIGRWNGATLSLRIGRRERTQDPIVYTAPIPPSSRSGIFRSKASGRFHTFELTISQSSGAAWSLAQALDIDAIPDGGK